MGSDFFEGVRDVNNSLDTISKNSREAGETMACYKYASEYAKGKEGDYLENYHKGLKEAESKINESRNKY